MAKTAKVANAASTAAIGRSVMNTATSMCRKWSNPRGNMLRIAPPAGIGDAPPSFAAAAPQLWLSLRRTPKCPKDTLEGGLGGSEHKGPTVGPVHATQLEEQRQVTSTTTYRSTVRGASLVPRTDGGVINYLASRAARAMSSATTFGFDT